MTIQRYCLIFPLDIFLPVPIVKPGAFAGIKYQTKRMLYVPQMCISDVCLDGGACISAVAATSPGAVEYHTIDLKQHGIVL